jgi:hypothetical protein
MMKAKLLGLAVMLVAIVGQRAAAEDVSGAFDVVCVVSDKTADPDENNKISLFKKQSTNPEPCEKGEVSFHLGDHINLLVEHAAGASFEDADQPNATSLVLYLDGRYLPGTYAKIMRSQSEDETEEENQVTRTVLRYELSRDLSTPEGRRNWTEVVTGDKFGKTLNLSTGLEKGEAVPSNAQIRLIILTPTRLFLAIAVALALAVLFVFLLLRTGALRDKEPAGPDTRAPTHRAYSLSRVQAMLWTLLTVYAFLFVYYLTGEYNATIPASLVTLMAISLGTFGTAAAIDSNSSNTKEQKARAMQNKVAPEYSDLVRQKNETEQEVTKLQKKTAAASDADLHQSFVDAHKTAQLRLDDITERLRKDHRNHRLWMRATALQKSGRVAPHSGFWSDLFSNEGGAGMHRVQFGLWTLVLMIVFVYEVFQKVSMPDFDKTLLALMGVSSGVYAGLKIPEDKGSGDTAASDDSDDANEKEDDDSE